MPRWTPIPGYETHYVITQTGLVKRIAKNTRGRDTRGTILKPVMSGGYWQVSLAKDGEVRAYRVHQLLMSTFIGPCPEVKERNHKDGDKLNNSLSNLEYVTHSENMLHSVHVLGKRPLRGERHGNSKLTDAQVVEAKAMITAGMDKRSISRHFGMHWTWAYEVASGRNRRDVVT